MILTRYEQMIARRYLLPRQLKHAGLKVLRFFWEYRPDVLTKKQILDGMTALMGHPDIADMPIDDLRKWKAWDMTAAVLNCAKLESHNTLPINRRAIEPSLLAADERAWLDAYHAETLEKVGPLVDAETLAWLEAACAPL